MSDIGEVFQQMSDAAASGDGWNERYEAASAEYAEAQWGYRLAESAMARAISHLNNAERVLNRIYHERAEQINGRVGGPQGG